jgi:sigma-E factor negative regulatory protein RseB
MTKTHTVRRFLCLALLLAALPAARAADSAAARRDFVALLQSVEQASRTQDYSGVYTYQQGDETRSLRLVHLASGGAERERLFTLDGASRECLRENRDVQCLLPEQKTVLTGLPHGDRFPGLLAGEPVRVAEHYALHVSDHFQRVAGRPCRLIALLPRDPLRYAHHLCVDVETNLLLKTQTLDASNRVIDQIAFSSLRQGGAVDAAQIGSPWNTGDWKRVRVDAQPADLSAQGWRVAAPPGYAPVLQVSRKMEGHEGEVGQMVLSDGLAMISVFIEPYNSALHGQAPAGGLTRSGPTNIHGKRVADFWLMAMGEVPMAALTQLIEASRFEPPAAPR